MFYFSAQLMKYPFLMAAALLLSAPALAAPADGDLIGKNQIELQGDRLTPEALWAMGRIGSVTASPDGRTVVYTVSYYSVQQNKSRTVLYRMNADGTDHTLLTTEAWSESEPAFIKGGQKIAFLTARSGKSQVWEMNLDGTGRRALTQESDDVAGFKFSPDERHVVLIKDVPATTSIEAKHADLPLASGMVITEMNYKHWDRYVTTIPHIFVADFDGNTVGTSRDILEGEPYECPMLPFGGSEQFNWSPDSKKIVYCCRKKTGRDYVISTDSDIFVYDIHTRITTNMCKPSDYQAPATDPARSLADQAVNKQAEDLNMGYDTNPKYSPDGRYIAWQSMERDGYESDRTRLCVLHLSSGRKTYVTESFESGVDDFCWADDSRTLYFTGVWHATSRVHSTNLNGEVKTLADGDYDYNGLTLCGNRLLVKRHSLSAPDDIYALDLDYKRKPAAPVQLTHENQYFFDRLKMGDVKARWVPTRDGKKELCWVVYPPHFDPSKKYPAVIFCQGGPQSPVSQFWSYRWNLQIMAANDYIVIAPNRRGLPGFGMEWLEAISGDYAGACMNDYLDAIDHLCQEEYVDRDRLGCVGASFGGFSVYWLAGHHEGRFKCFISHDGIFNTQAQYLETEEMWFPNWDFGAAPWQKGITAPAPGYTSVAIPAEKPGKSNAFTHSPHLYVDRWDTPILCIHGEKDYRILSSQGESAFNAARLRGIPAELLLYPDENHWVLKPQNGVLWQRTFFRWLDRWLKK